MVAYDLQNGILRRTLVRVRVYGLYGAYNHYDVVRQVSRFIIVSVSAYRTCHVLSHSAVSVYRPLDGVRKAAS